MVDTTTLVNVTIEVKERNLNPLLTDLKVTLGDIATRYKAQITADFLVDNGRETMRFPTHPDLLRLPIRKAGLPEQIRNVLLRGDIGTVGKLVLLTEEELLNIPMVGPATLEVILNRLEKLGLKLVEDREENQ